MVDCVEGVEEKGCCCIAPHKGGSDILYLVSAKKTSIKGFAMAVYMYIEY